MTRIVLWALVMTVFLFGMLWLAQPARALTDGQEQVCQPRTWSDCQTMERFTPVHQPVLKITDKVGGRNYG